MHTRRLTHLLFLLLGMLPAATLHAEEETTPTLVLSVTEWTGLSAPELELTATAPGGEAESATTNRRGLAEFRLPALESGGVRISIPDGQGRLVLTGEAQRSAVRRIYLRRFPADLQEDPEAMLDLAESVTDLYRTVQLFGGEDTAPPGEVTALRQFAFLRDEREEVLHSKEDYSDEATPGTGALSVRVVNERGQDQPGVPLELFTYNRSERMVQYVTAERTNELGIAVFSGLAPSALYRVETAREFATTVRSGIFTVSPDENRTLPPLVLHPTDRRVAGFLLFGEKPAVAFEVRSRNTFGQPVLTTMADASGFFVLGPLRAGDVDLEFREPGSTVWRGAVLKTTGDREQLIPVDWVSR